MDVRFLPHNIHLEDPGAFFTSDPHLKQLQRQVWVHHSRLLDKLPGEHPGIYTLGGGRQVGKTTLAKQWMARLLTTGIRPERIAYLTGELIDDHHSLVRLIMEMKGEMVFDGLVYLVIDEVTYIRDWDRGVKYLADAGLLEQVVMLLTGSDLVIIQEARMRFPGRRGTAATVDYHLYPLSFLETVELKEWFTADTMDRLRNSETEPADATLDILYEEFDLFLTHGGFLPAINDLAKYQRILPATFSTYSDWIRGDVLKRAKNEHYLREVLGGILKRYGSQVTWNALAQDLSIDHPKTVADYIALLVSMDAVYVQSALMEDKLTAAPKKARKVMFTDPFIYHALAAWLKPGTDPYVQQVRPTVADPALSARLAEACVVTHYRRFYPTYYIKADGEVDVAYIDRDRFHPLEVKWTRQSRAKDLKQIARYPGGRILTKARQRTSLSGVPTEPLPLALLRLPLPYA